jgi:hypothetical protein
MKMKDHDFKADIEPDRSALPQKRLTFLITIERPIGSLTMFVISCISFSCCPSFRERAATRQSAVPAARRIERRGITYLFLRAGEGGLCRSGLPMIYSHI